MEKNSQINQKDLLESQIRECYGKVVYTHKTHEKCADILLKKNSSIKFWKLILSGITTGSLIVNILGKNQISLILGTIMSTILLILNSYTKDFELVEVAEKHKDSANELWNIREKYLSLITDFSHLPIEKIKNKRDKLQENLFDIYKGSPRTNFKAYNIARDSLKSKEEMTFSEKEIDNLLPKKLRKS